MESVLATLKDTPIPTILVVAGIAFLLLAIAGQLAGRIVVAPERQRWAAMIGAGLLAIGITLHVIPQVPWPGPQGTSAPQPTPEVESPHERADPAALYRIRTTYAGASHVEFLVFVNEVQTGAYSSDDVNADITPFIKPGANTVRVAWTADPKMSDVARLIIEAKQGRRWSRLISQDVRNTTKAGEATSTIIHHGSAPQ